MFSLKRVSPAEADASPLGKRIVKRDVLSRAVGSSAKKTLDFASMAVDVDTQESALPDMSQKFSRAPFAGVIFLKIPLSGTLSLKVRLSHPSAEHADTEGHSLWSLCLKHPLADATISRAHIERIKKLSKQEQPLELYFLLYYLACAALPDTNTSLLEYRCHEIKQELRALQQQWKPGEPSLHERYCMRVLVRTLILPSHEFLPEGVNAARALLSIFCDPEYSTTPLGICTLYYDHLHATLSDIESNFSQYKQIFESILKGEFAVHSSLHSLILLDWGLPSTEKITPLRTAWACCAAVLQLFRQDLESNCFLIAPLNAQPLLVRLKKILEYLSSGCVLCETRPLLLAPLLSSYLFNPKATSFSLSSEELSSHPATARIAKYLPSKSLEEEQKAYLHFPEKWHAEVRQLLASHFCSPLLQLLVVATWTEYLNAPFSGSPRDAILTNMIKQLEKLPGPVSDKSDLLHKHLFLYPFSTRTLQEEKTPKEFVKFLIYREAPDQNIYCDTFEILLEALQEINATCAHWLNQDLVFHALPSVSFDARTTLYGHFSFLYKGGGYTHQVRILINSAPFERLRYVEGSMPRDIFQNLHQYGQMSIKNILAVIYGHAFRIIPPLATYTEAKFSAFIDSLPKASRPATELLYSLTQETLSEVAKRLHITLPLKKIASLFHFEKPCHPFYLASSLYLWCQAHSIKISQYVCYRALCDVLDLSPVIPCGDFNWYLEKKGVRFAYQYVFFYNASEGAFTFGRLSPEELVPEKPVLDVYINKSSISA